MEDIKNFEPFIQGYIMFLVTFIGMIFGSFFNVVVLRLLAEESFVSPPSRCPKCKTKIRWFDNIPVFSYVFLLRGKCRNCKEKISIQYPLVELFTGIVFLGIFLVCGLTLKTLMLWILSGSMIVMSVTDIKEKIIFDITAVPFIPIGLVYSFFDLGNSGLGQKVISLGSLSISLNNSFISALIAVLIAVLFFEVISGIGYLFLGQRAFGEGDTIIASVLGAWLGWKAMVAIIVISFIVQLIIGIPVILNNMYKDKDFKSIKATAMLLFSVVIPLIGRLTGLSDNLIFALLFAIAAFGVAFVSVGVILKNVKERQSYTYMPFGPPLVVGGFIMMFWGEPVIRYMLSIYQ